MLAFVLASALYLQFFQHEAPCPLCLLQRVGLCAVGLGLLLNLLYGEKASHWGLVIFSALAGITASMRQIGLHLLDPVGFSISIWGLHLYTWSFIIFSCVLVITAIMLITMPEHSSNS
jgi:disulfide bond formation protein DsbB